MNLDWILSPITHYSLLALGLLACLGLCISTSIRMRAERRGMLKSQETLGHTVTALSAAVEDIRREVTEPEMRAPAPLRGFNLTKRAQALRMHRRGESLPTIAAALESPQNEIEMLVKVHGYLNS